MDPAFADESFKDPSKRGFDKRNALNSEFLYYSSLIKLLASSLTGTAHRELVLAWLQKLFRPEYHSSQLKEKRNRYLLGLILMLLNDETYGVFRTLPPSGSLPEVEMLERDTSPAAQWELDDTWEEIIKSLPHNFHPLKCTIHNDKKECELDHSLDKILDNEFKFLLYIVKPYAALLQKEEDRTIAAAWLQMLCSIVGPCCGSLRGIRNDYIMALLGYLHDLRLAGPFASPPSKKSLVPLPEAAEISAESIPLTDPSSPEAANFISQQHLPDEGAFCYIALTGDLMSTCSNTTE